ncbi:hypothetical protein Tco_1293388 [Tanacetum coccineum]
MQATTTDWRYEFIHQLVLQTDWKEETEQSRLRRPSFQGHRVVPDVSKPLPLGGPPGQVTIQTQYFFNKDLEYLVSGDNGRRSVLSISKLKATQYLDFGLEELVPSLWIESERDYDISAAYELTTRNTRSQKPTSKICIQMILKTCTYFIFKASSIIYLVPTKFISSTTVNLWIRNIVIRKRVEDLQLKIESYQTKLIITQPDWDASDFLFKEDYTIVSKPRAVIYRDIIDQKKMMRETKVHKFSDGTLNRILDKLDHIVKDLKLFKFNPGMETRIWSEDDRRRSKEFMENIRVIPKYHSEDGNPARANIKQALGSFQDQERYEHDGPQDTRPQDGERSQDDDQRLDLADDLKKAQDHISTIVYDDALTCKSNFLTEPTLSPQHIDEFDLKDETSFSECDEVEQNVLYFNDLFSFNISYPDNLQSDKDNDDNKIDIIQSSGDMAFPPRDQRHQYLRYGGLKYTNADIADFETRLAKIYIREVHNIHVFDFWGMSDLMAEGLRGRMLRDRVCLLAELGGGYLRLEALEEIETAGFGLYWAKSARQIHDKGDLSAYWIGISSMGDILGTPPSYTLIRDPMLGLLHRLIACSMAGRSQAPEKVTVTNLFYLRGMDVGSVNVPYLLARYLRLFASGRKQGAMISGGQFDARLAEHFGLLTKERLQGLTVIMRDLPVIDMTELVRLQICEEIDDTWAWVAQGPKRQQVAAAGVPEASKDAPVADEGAPAIPAPVQAPQPPPPVAGPAQTMAQRLARVEEDMHEIRGELGEQREILDSMAYDFSQFSTWTVVGLSQMTSQARVRYTSYADFQIPYARHTRRRTDGANTSTTQQDEKQPDP